MTADARSFNRARNQVRRTLQRSPHRAHDLLRSGIRTGFFADEASLAEDTLIARLSTSRNSIRQALQMLASEGLVRRRPNVGTSVVASIAEVPIDEIVSAASMAVVDATVRELDQREIPATDYMRARLESDCETVDMNEVLVSTGGEPRSVRVSYVPASDGPVRRVTEIVPVSVAFAQVFGVPLGSCEAAVSAIAAGPSLSGLLAVPPGAPVLIEEVVLRDIDGRAREFSYTHHRGDRIALSMNLLMSGAKRFPR